MSERPTLGSNWSSWQKPMVIKLSLAANSVASQLAPKKMSGMQPVFPGEKCDNYKPHPGGGPHQRPLIREHAFPLDTLNIVCGPPALHMYDSDPPDCKQALLSPGCHSNISESLSSPTTLEAFDLKPHFEDSNPDLLKVYLGISRSNSDQDLHALDHLCMKLEEEDGHPVDPSHLSTSWENAFKMEQDIGEPTLAELNNDNTTVLSFSDDLELRFAGEANEKLVLNSASGAVAQQGLNSMLTNENVHMNNVMSTNERGLMRPCTVNMTSVNQPVIKSLHVSSSSSVKIPSAAGTVESQSRGGLQQPMYSSQGRQTASGMSSGMTIAQQQLVALNWSPSSGIRETPASQSVGVPPSSPSTLHGLLQATPIKIEPQVDSPILQTLATSENPFQKNAASAASPTHRAGMKRSLSPDNESALSSNSEDVKWAEIKEFIDSEKKNGGFMLPVAGPDSGAASVASVPTTMQNVSPKRPRSSEQDIVFTISDPQSEDEDNDSMDNDSDHDQSDDDDLSDAESETNYSSFAEEFLKTTRKEKRFFWQYNTQAKGPKGKRLCKSMETEDPHVLHDFEDPVFDTEIHNMQYKHNGRARRGDGNDINPNPWKLFQIGNELSNLNRKIHMMGSGQELPAPTRNKTRREKNKFASRACRLKKKAQHEAHKLKLFGLEQEHFQLMTVLDNIKTEVRQRVLAMKANITVFPDTLVDLTEKIKKKKVPTATLR